MSHSPSILSPPWLLALVSLVLVLPGGASSEPPVSQAAAGGAASTGGEGGRPNIILFLVDDLGWQDTSVALHTEPTPFNERYRTPHLERLARRGMRFTRAYASAPVCTPTRTSIMTGQSPGRSHITYWTLHKDRDTSRSHPRVRAPAWNMNGLSADDLTLAKLLQAAGYRTIHAGKAHFGAHGTTGADPRALGFDVNIAGHGSGAPASYYGTHRFARAGRQGEPDGAPSVWDVPGLEPYHGQDVYLTEALAIEAATAITEAVERGQPFYLDMAPYAVHTPIMPNARYAAHYEGLNPREVAYATMIETVDAALGSIMQTLETLDIAEETFIIFSSDNGGLSAHARGGVAHTHNAPLRSGKGSAYEGGTRVPTIIAGPGVASGGGTGGGGGGAVDDTPIISHDLFPTILAWAKVNVPAEYARQVDGRDLGPLLRREAGAWAPRALFWHQPHQWGAQGPGIAPFTSILYRDRKLIYFHADRRFELYDLEEDIGETNDLAAQDPGTVRFLARSLDRWIEAVDGQLSIDVTTNRPVSTPGEAAP